MKKQFLLLLFFFVSTFSSAQFTTDTLVNYKVDDKPGSTQLESRIVTTASGLTYITWFDRSSGNYDLRMQLLDKNGFPQWAQGGIVISAEPQDIYLYNYDLKTDNNNNAIVAFQDKRSGSLQVVANKFSTSGASLWGNGIVLRDSTSDGLNPTIAVLSTNDVVIAWSATLGNAKWAAYSKISAGGQLKWIKRIWNNQNYSRPAVLPSSGKGFKMLYVLETGSGASTISYMYTQRFDSSGTGLWPFPVLVSMKTIVSYFFPEIVSDGSDGFYVAFETDNQFNAALTDVYLQRVDSLGSTWSANGTVCSLNSTEHKFLGGVAVKANKTGASVLLTVRSFNYTYTGLSMQVVDSSGNVQLGTIAFELHPLIPDWYVPFGIVDLNGSVLVVYEVGGVSAQIMYGLKVDYNGTQQWGSEHQIAALLCNKLAGRVSAFVNGQVIVVWGDDRLDEGIYAQNIATSGYMGPGVGLEEQSFVSEASLFPNPSACPKLKLQCKVPTQLTMKMFNPLGQLVYANAVFVQAGFNELLIPGLGKGVYLVELSSDEGILWQEKWISE